MFHSHRREFYTFGEIIRSKSASMQPDHFDGLEHDQQIPTNRSVLDVEEVMLDFFSRILDRVDVLVFDLRPAGDTGPRHVAHAVKRNLLRERLDEFRALGPRAGNCHIAFEHAPQPGNVIQALGSENSADAGHAGIVFDRPLRTLGRFGVLPLGTELHDYKEAPTLAVRVWA